MATTTNYGWTTPDDTALVKDGASAIRTLGSSVDTTTKNLNPSTTLGDIEFRSSTSNVNTRLGIGGTGTVLTVAAGVPSWATPSSGGMTLIASGTLSGASTTISSIPGTYYNLELVVRNVVVSTSGQCQIQLNGDTGTKYRYLSSNTNGSAMTYIQDRIGISEDTLTATGNNLINATIFDYANTSTRKLMTSMAITQNTATPNYNLTQFNSTFNDTGAISSIVFVVASGTYTSGNYFLYGVK